MNAASSVAKKYARAFLNIYGNSVSLDQCSAFQSSASFFKDNHRFVLVLKLSYIPNDVKREMVQKLVDYYALPSTVKHLVSLLIEDQRLFLLPVVFEWIVDLYYHDNNIELFDIATSHQVNDAQVKDIEKFLADKTGKKVMAAHKVQPALIAGVSCQSDYHKWEYSIKQQLESIENFFSKD